MGRRSRKSLFSPGTKMLLSEPLSSPSSAFPLSRRQHKRLTPPCHSDKTVSEAFKRISFLLSEKKSRFLYSTFCFSFPHGYARGGLYLYSSSFCPPPGDIMHGTIDHEKVSPKAYPRFEFAGSSRGDICLPQEKAFD